MKTQQIQHHTFNTPTYWMDDLGFVYFVPRGMNVRSDWRQISRDEWYERYDIDPNTVKNGHCDE